MTVAGTSYIGPPVQAPGGQCGAPASATLDVVATGSTWAVDVTSFVLVDHFFFEAFDFEAVTTITSSPQTGTIGAWPGYPITQDLELETVFSSGSLSACSFPTWECQVVETCTGLTGNLTGSISGSTIASGPVWAASGTGSRVLDPGCSYLFQLALGPSPSFDLELTR